MLYRTLVVLAAAAALGCVPVATNTFAAEQQHRGGHNTGSHAMGSHATGAYARGSHGGQYGGGGGQYGGGGGYYGDGGGYYGDGGGYYGDNGGAYYGGDHGNGPIYNSCNGYDPNYGPGYVCPGYGVPLVGGVINGILGGYSPY